MEAKKRLYFIDLTKIIAILLIVVSHCNVLPDKVNIFINSFYISVFFICTGYTFNPAKVDDKKNLLKQIIKILKYYFFYSLIILIMFSALSIVKSDFSTDSFINNIIGIFYSRFYLFHDNKIVMGMGNAPMWFLTCYLLSYSLFFLTFKLNKKIKYIIPIIFVIISYIFSLFDFLLPWSMDVAPLMSFFIYLGYYIKEKDIVKNNIIIMCVSFVLLAIMTYFNTEINYSVKVYGINYFYTVLMSIIGSLALLMLCYKLCSFKLFGKISVLGNYTIDIMCYHLMIIFAINIAIKNIYISTILVLIITLLVSKLVNKIVKLILKT
jgi:fucose 4-O-acetylase-like acetyltransferase